VQQSSSLYLSLVDPDNAYQRELERHALSAAIRTGLALDVSYCDIGVVRQIQQLRAAIAAPAAKRAAALLVLPVRDGALDDVARDALRSGVGWVILNRRAAPLEHLRQSFPKLPVFSVTPDDFAIGNTQGRQLRVLFPQGARALLLRGETTSATAVVREAGLRDALSGSDIELDALEGGWTAEGAERSVSSYIRTHAAPGVWLEAVVCQNDEMARGAHRALGAANTTRSVHVLGCDGLPGDGQRLVEEGKLAATVILPTTTGPAIEMLARVLLEGARAPAELLLPVAPFPSDSV
jgi:inositol transport system substrate-binding protein